MEDPDSRDAPTKPALPAGAASRRQSYTLDARFEYIREIARGGMGRVVEARDNQLGRIVAVKESLDNSPDAQMRFEREVAITARLEHPSIVPVYDAGVAADGTPFYVMRRVSGAPLDELVRKASTLDKRLRLLPHLLAVSDAIAHAHQRDVIHRDVKPSNVLVGELGETIVIDWGLAKTGDESELVASMQSLKRGALETAAGAVIGTPGFMAPEQVGGGSTDPRSDVYALGASLYFLLSGRTPFHGSAEAEVLDRTKRGALDPLDRVVPGVPKDLLTIVTKAMSREPANRYLDAGGFSEDLRRFLGGQLVASHHYPPLQRAYRWARSHRTAVVAVLGVAIAATITVVALRRVLHERERTAASSDSVLIIQATELLATDPTRAIATLQQLRPESPRWATLGPLLAEARTRGIAVGYPGHDHHDSIHFARTHDDRIVSSGNGVVRLTNLSARTQTVLVEGHPGLHASWCGGLVVIAPSSDTPLRVIDPVTKQSAEIEWSSIPSKVSTADGVIAFVDDETHVVTLDLTTLPITTKPTIVEGVTDATSVELSPTGRWMIVWGKQRTRLYERSDGWKLAIDVPVFGHEGRFDAAEKHFALRFEDGTRPVVAEYDLETARERRRWATSSAFHMEYVRGSLFLVGFGFIAKLADDGQQTTLVKGGTASAASVTNANGWLVVLESSRSISISRGSFKRTIRSPIDLTGVRADRRGRFLVGFAGGTLLAWDLREVLPQRFESVATDTVTYVDNDSVVATFLDPTGRRSVEHYRFSSDFRTVAHATIASVAVFSELVVLPERVILARDRISNHEHPISPALDRGDIRAVGVLDAKTLVVGTRDGRVERVDRESGDAKQVAKAGVAIGAIDVNGRWIAAQSDDSTGIVIRIAGERETRAALGATQLGVALTADGTVYVARGRELVAWTTSSAPTAALALPNDILAVRTVAGDRIAALTSDHSLHIYDPRTRVAKLMVHGAFGPPGPDLDISLAGTHAISRTGGALAAVDLTTGAHWSLADTFDPRAIALAPDGHAVIASDKQDEALLRFRVTPPPATAEWVKAATNALPPRSPSAVLEWRPR